MMIAAVITDKSNALKQHTELLIFCCGLNAKILGLKTFHAFNFLS